MARRKYYYVDISHDGLKKFRRIKGVDKLVVAQIAARQQLLWDEQWAKKQQAESEQRAKKQQAESKRSEREATARQKEAQKEAALEQTQQAQGALQEIEDLLKHALDEGVIFKWESLLKTEDFPEPEPPPPPPQGVPPQAKWDESCLLAQIQFS